MSGLSSKPKAPVIQGAPRTPQKSDAEIAAASEEEKQKRKLQKGRAATILSRGAMGDDTASPSGLATKTLLGS